MIDTGSSLTFFDRGAGDALHIDYDASVPRSKVRIAGGERHVVMDRVTLTLPPFEDLSWEAEVGFFEEEWDLPFGILGTQGFLDRWAVSFNAGNDYFTVEPVEEWERRMGIDPFEEFQKLDRDWQPPA